MKKLLKIISRICLVLGVFFLLYCFSIAELDKSYDYKKTLKQIISADYSQITLEDAAIYTKSALKSAKEHIPEVAATMAHLAVSGAEFGQPIDENPTQSVTPVFSVQGGTVTETGQSEDLGNYIVISHAKGAKSVYGNCCRVYVQRLERVKKGQVIGEFDMNSETEFCYSLVTNE